MSKTLTQQFPGGIEGQKSDGSFVLLNDEIAALEARLKAREQYIELLGAEINELIPLAFTHGWVSTRAEEGRRLRAIIAAARKEQEE